MEQLRSQARHQVILDAALRVFTHKGYRDATVEDIASESRTSKGGIYFHFPTKQAIFLALLDRTASLLQSRIESSIADERDPVEKAERAIRTVLDIFASHRTLARLFLVEALGAGREFDERLAAIRASFARMVQEHLDDAVRREAIPPIDTEVASRVWLGALNEIVTAWLMADRPSPLEATYPTVRTMLLRSIGVDPDRSRYDLPKVASYD